MAQNRRGLVSPIASVIPSIEGIVCSRRSSRPGRDFRTSVRGKRFAGDARVMLQPECPCGKTDLRTREKRGTRFSIGLDSRLVSPQGFNAPPQLLAGHARRQLSSRLSRARAVAPVLIESGAPPDSFARARTLCGGLALDGGDPFLKACGEFAVRRRFQPSGKMMESITYNFTSTKSRTGCTSCCSEASWRPS